MLLRIVNNIVFRNFVSLGILQVINYLAPLIIIPHLIRVLGVSNLGDINFSQTIISYAIVFVTFGYNYVGTKSVSENASDKDYLAKVLLESIVFRTILCIIGFIFLLFLAFFIDKINDVKWIVLSFYGLVVSQILFPTWFFHGLQKMRYVLYLGASSKIIVLIFTFYFINDSGDGMLVPIINSCAGIIIGIVSLSFIVFKLGIPLSLRGSRNFLTIIKENYYSGRDVFLQQTYVSLYGPINIVFLGLLASSEVVGYFTIVEKVIYIPIIFFSMAGQAFYPYAVKIFKDNKERYYSLVKRFMILIFAISFLASCLFAVFHKLILSLIIGHSSSTAEILLYIMIFGIPFAAMGNVLTQIFVTINKSEILNKISFIIMIITLSSSWWIIECYGAMGLSVFIVLRQFIVVVVCVTIILKIFKKRLL